MSTSCPPDVIHVIGVPRPSPFFVLFRFHVLRKPKNKQKKKNGGGLGMRLWYHCITDKLSRLYFLVKQQDVCETFGVNRKGGTGGGGWVSLSRWYRGDC